MSVKKVNGRIVKYCTVHCVVHNIQNNQQAISGSIQGKREGYLMCEAHSQAN